MGATPKLVRAVASIALASLVSLVGFLFVMLAPIGVFELIYGRQSVEDAPGHGAAFVFWSGPVAAVFAFSLIVGLSFRFYARFTKPHRVTESGTEYDQS
jgi:hypothetical protein